MGIISLTVTCGLLVASHWRREATKYARWIAFTGSKWTFSLKLMRRPLEIPLHHTTSVYLCIYAEQWIIKWEEVRLNRCGNLVLAESCTSSFTCVIMCTAAETSEATHRISVSLCFSEWCEDLRVGVCVCVLLHLHIYENYFIFYFVAFLSIMLSPWSRYWVMRFVWHLSGWLMCHGNFLFIYLFFKISLFALKSQLLCPPPPPPPTWFL